MVNDRSRGISACAVRFAKYTELPFQQPNMWWKVMSRSLAIIAVALSISLSAPAFAGWEDGNGNPQGAPGGHGGEAFGVSENDHVSPNGHVDPSGTNGNQASETGAAHSGNDNRGNAGGPGGEEGCDGEC
jgi:hypothetical protein